jgi:DNA-binding IclR family transcriptional regulator
MPKRGSGDALRSVSRALKVLEWFSFDHPEGTVSQIAADLGLARSTVSRLLVALASHGLVQSGEPSTVYRLHWSSLRFGSIIRGTNRLVAAATPEMDRLHAETGVTVTLSVLDDRSIVHVATREALGMPPMYRPVGYRWKAHSGGSTGRVLIAWLDDEDLARVLPPDPEWEPGGAAHEDLRRAIECVRREEIAFNDAERNPAVWSVAAPVRHRRGNVVAALALSVPRDASVLERTAAMVDGVRGGALRISAQLGWHGMDL